MPALARACSIKQDNHGRIILNKMFSTFKVAILTGFIHVQILILKVIFQPTGINTVSVCWIVLHPFMCSAVCTGEDKSCMGLT